MNSASDNNQEATEMSNPLAQATNKELLRIKTGYGQHASYYLNPPALQSARISINELGMPFSS